MENLGLFGREKWQKRKINNSKLTFSENTKILLFKNKHIYLLHYKKRKCSWKHCFIQRRTSSSSISTSSQSLAWCNEQINIRIKRGKKIEVKVMVVYLENDFWGEYKKVDQMRIVRSWWSESGSRYRGRGSDEDDGELREEIAWIFPLVLCCEVTIWANDSLKEWRFKLIRRSLGPHRFGLPISLSRRCDAFGFLKIEKKKRFNLTKHFKSHSSILNHFLIYLALPMIKYEISNLHD